MKVLRARLAASVLALAAGTCLAADSGFEKLFNGKDLTGWTGDPNLWSVQQGVITGRTTPEKPTKVNTFLIWTNGTVADFELRCEYKITPNNPANFGNSGIQYRSKVFDPERWTAGGYQADIEAGTNYTGILYEEKMTRGIMAQRGQKVLFTPEGKKVTGSVGTAAEVEAAIKRGDWNEYVIIARGNHLQHFVNGQQTIDVVDEDAAKAATSGILALQLHVGQPMTVQFRNLRLKKL